MIRSRIYYRFKPYLPRSLRMAARRFLARRQRLAYAKTWPINEAAGKTPPDWPGWPGGKKFALVLTHDVEGSHGLGKCRELMRLEKALGFRSSFNFIPEGEYEVTPKLRDELVSNGFEVGVHDLRHDGKLYWPRDDFSTNARSINSYLSAWGSAGFRSGFMLHDHDCLHELEIEYDASTLTPIHLNRNRKACIPSFHFGRRGPTVAAMWNCRIRWLRTLRCFCPRGNIDGHLEEEARLDRATRRHGACQRASGLCQFRW